MNVIEAKVENKATIDNGKFTEEKLLNYINLACEKATKNIAQRVEKCSKDGLELQAKTQAENIEFEREKLRTQQEMHREDIKTEERKYNIDRCTKFIAAIIAAVSILQYVYSGLHQENANNRRAANQYKIDLVREDMAEKKKILQKGAEAIGNLRTVDAEVIRKCKYGHPYFQEEQERLRWNALQGVIDTFATVAYTFNDEVLHNVSYLIISEDQIKDICNYKGDYDNHLLELKKSIFNPAHKLLLEDAKKIEKLK